MRRAVQGVRQRQLLRQRLVHRVHAWQGVLQPQGSNRRQAPDLTRRGPLSAQLNGGGACYESAADLPPVRTAAGMGGGFYFAIIVGAQVLGALLEVVLILRWAEVRFSNPARTEGDTRAQCVALLAICNHSRVRA